MKGICLIQGMSEILKNVRECSRLISGMQQHVIVYALFTKCYGMQEQKNGMLRNDLQTVI